MYFVYSISVFVALKQRVDEIYQSDQNVDKWSTVF
jgi:hypothetical protein